MLFLIVPGFLCAALVALFVWRCFDHRADRLEMNRLLALQPNNPPCFSRAMVSDLPELVQRYFSFSIAEGTPLWTVAEIDMVGKFSLGSKDAPDYKDMRARQVLAAPEGFVWKMSAETGLFRLSGSDSGTWTRFWMAGLAPVARFGGTPDHSRSAFGRYVAEAVFWTPAALLPGPHVSWQGVSENVARMTMRYGDLEQAVDLTVDAEGRPEEVAFSRWSNANPEKRHRLQPFGGYLSEFREFDGFRLPTHIEAGNFFGTGDYFPFFIADVSDVRFGVKGRQ